MSAARASKRRKLAPTAEKDDDDDNDNDHHDKSHPISAFASTSHKHQQQYTSSAPPARSTGPSSSTGYGGQSRPSPASAKERLWLRAKAESRTYRIRESKAVREAEKDADWEEREREKERELYEDVEGAHVPRAGRPKTMGVQVGFFKQFAKANGQAGDALAGVAGGGKTAVKGVGHMEKSGEDVAGLDEMSPDGESGGEDMEVDNSEVDEAEEEEQQSGHQPNGHAATKRWVYGKPKRTFEDEIRELEETARRTAENEDSLDELARPGDTLRSSARKSVPRAALARNETGQRALSSPIPKAARTLDRRKTKRAPAAAQEPSDIKDPDNIEIDERGNEDFAPNTAQLNQNLESSVKSTPKEPDVRSSVKFQHAHLQCIQRVLLGKVANKRPIPLANLEEEYAKVMSLVNQTITAGESNSMLLIGARGSGKTALVEHILRDQAAKHRDDFHVIRLSGFIHTDDKIALREIWRQLGREMELDEEESTSKNYADTMSKLLALLSHPAETGTEQPGQVTKSVIFVLDEFGLFAGHPRQTLLYNLFDIAQSRKAPIAVLGLTTKIDVAESLEKRVKSRFSHRYVHLGLAKNLRAFEQICRNALMLKSDELTDEELAELGGSKEQHDVVLKPNPHALPAVLAQWNTVAEQIIASPACAKAIQSLYHTTKSAPEFLTALHMPLALLPINNSPTSTTTDATTLLSHFSTTLSTPTATLHAPDSNLSLLPSLTTLQLALLICAARLTNVFALDAPSFALAYQEYTSLAAKARLQASASGARAHGATTAKVWGKDVAKEAWRGLVEAGLILLADGVGGGRAAASAAAAAGAAGRVDVGLEEIGMSGVELGSWGRWCREI